MFFNTEDPENGSDNCGHTKCFIMLLHRKSSAFICVIRCFLCPQCQKTLFHHAALIREIVRSLISVNPMSVPIFSTYPSFMFSMPSGSR